MQNVFVDEKAFNQLNPETILLSLFVGGDDVLTMTGQDVLNNHPHLTLWEAFTRELEDISGNSFKISWFNKKFYELTLL